MTLRNASKTLLARMDALDKDRTNMDLLQSVLDSIAFILMRVKILLSTTIPELTKSVSKYVELDRELADLEKQKAWTHLGYATPYTHQPRR